MATLRAVLARHDEKLNLWNITLCVGLVVLLVTLAFGLLTFRPLFQNTPDQNRAESHAGEVRGTN